MVDSAITKEHDHGKHVASGTNIDVKTYKKIENSYVLEFLPDFGKQNCGKKCLP